MMKVVSVRDSIFSYLCENSISCHVWYYDDDVKTELELYGVLQKGLTDGIYRIGMNMFDVDNVKRVRYNDRFNDGAIIKDFKFVIKEGIKENE